MTYQYYRPRQDSAKSSKVSQPVGFRDVLNQLKTDDDSGTQQTNRRRGQDAIVRRHRPDYYIVLFMSLLMLVGLVVMFAISPQIVNVANNSRGADISRYYYFTKQIISVVVCVISFIVASLVPLKFLRSKAGWLLVLAVGSSLLLFALSKIYPSLACNYGACRWLRIGGFSIQVSEIVKLCLLLFMAFLWSYFMKRHSIENTRNLIYSSVIIGLALFAIVVLQKDLGTGISLFIIMAFMLWMTGIKPSYFWPIVMTVVLAGGVLAVLAQPYRIDRVLTFLKGDEAAMTDENRHIIEAKIALGSGGLFGLGVGNSIQSTGYLPEVINDSIFAVIGEIFGFVGTVAIVLLFLALLWRLYRAITHSHNVTYRLILVGVFSWIFAHLAINLSSMTGLAPMTGITLPFLSSGGSSMLFASIALGIAFQLTAFTSHSPYYEDGATKRRYYATK